MKPILLTGLLAVLSLSACAYQGDLDKKLDGKERAARQAILIDECRKESRPPTVNSEQGQKRMDELCDAMIREMKSTN